ncbi:MAG: GerMN domain-containing protein [Pseudonocardia sp.]|nr:GerMN domain-containing protein [Pseudonocardia sp.]
MRRRFGRLGVLAAGLLAAALVGGCTGTSGAGDRGIRDTPAPTSVAPGVQQQRALPVYYVLGEGEQARLVREFHAVWTADPVSGAVAELLGEPPRAPDLRTGWPAGTTLRSPVARDSALVTVDLAVPGEVPPERAALTLQQLVYTVQGAAGTTDPVRLLVDGEPVDTLWGQDVSRPIPRADPYATRLLVQIDDPAEGATVSSPVTVKGEAAAFEATVLWEVRGRDGDVVRSGATTSEEGMRFSPFRFSVPLPPGTYDITVLEDDPSGGEGRPVQQITRRVTVV